MDEQVTTKASPKPPAAEAGPQNLSSEIERAVARDPLDRVRCVHLYDDHYRCNWWAPGGEDGSARPLQSPWAALATMRVRKSRFITARLTGGQLVMEPVESGGS